MDAHKPRVLLIEDDSALGSAAKALLDTWGYETHWAASANRAFEEIAHDGYRAALLDLNLGEDDGVQLVCSLRAAGHHVPPLVIVSAQTPEKLAVAAQKTGALEIVRKPYSLATLKRALERALIAPEEPARTPSRRAP